jgi:hypothetical protein
VRSNFDVELSLDIKPDPTFVKNVRDLEEEEKKRKEAEEKALREKEEENRGEPLQNVIPGGGTNIFQ